MQYYYYVKNIPLTKCKEVMYMPISITYYSFKPKFDGVFLVIPREVQVNIDSQNETITIGDKVYHFMDGGDFTSEAGIPVKHSYMH